MSLYLLREMSRSLKTKTLVLLLMGSLLWVVLFIGISAVSVVTEPEDLRQGARFWVITDDDLIQSDQENLYRLLSTAPEVSHARYDFSTSIGHFEVILRPGIQAGPVMELIRSWEGVKSVTLPQIDSAGALKSFAENPQNRNWLIGLGILFGLGGLVMIRWGLQEARRNFAGELEMLELAGVHPKTVRTPFMLLGGAIALTEAVVTGMVSFLFMLWLPVVPGAAGLLGVLLQPGMMELVALRGLLLAVAVGGVCCVLLGLLTYKYPKPFNLSRISSSSLAVRER